MAMEATLNAVTRGDFGKNAVRRLRKSGFIPAVLYGGPARGDGGRPEAEPIAVDPKVLLRILHSGLGANTLIGLHLGGEQSRVMIREYQLDPVTHALLHADFFRVALDKRVKVTVPVVLKGEARGVKQQGGLLDFVHRELEIECLPADIPERVEVDVSELMLHQGVRLRDLAENAKWTALDDADTLLVHVIAPKAEVEAPTPEAAAAAATATPAEPEVIKKGKAEKEEGEAEAAAPEKPEKREKK
jgi:large subunit ribosomal protein L25